MEIKNVVLPTIILIRILICFKILVIPLTSSQRTFRISHWQAALEVSDWHSRGVSGLTDYYGVLAAGYHERTAAGNGPIVDLNQTGTSLWPETLYSNRPFHGTIKTSFSTMDVMLSGSVGRSTSGLRLSLSTDPGVPYPGRIKR